MIKLIALDLDGTLLGPDRQVGEADSEAVAQARERGVHIVLNTARWYSLAQRTAQRLELRAPLICHNGAHIKEPADGRELLHKQIPQEVAYEVAAFCDEGGFETYTTIDGITYMRTPPKYQIDPQRLPNDMRLADRHAEFVTGPTTGILVFDEHAIEQVLDKFGERYQATLAFATAWSESLPSYVTITVTGTDKGAALQCVCEHLGVAPEDAMAVGDTAQDVPMFEAAGIGVAMGNAPDDVKQKADAVAPSNSEGGVAWAIRRFVLEES